MASGGPNPGDHGLASQAATDPRQIAEFYDEWANADYDADLAAWNYAAPAQAAELAIETVTDLSTARLLDAGCGTGLAGVELRRLGATHVRGGDFSPASVNAARARGVYDHVVHLDLNVPLDFPDNSFDAVVSVGVFSYLSDSRATILELLRITAAGGALVFTQRSDLWVDRDFDTLISSLVADGQCTATISDIAPYLPGHPEFGDDIGIRYVTLRTPEPVG